MADLEHLKASDGTRRKPVYGVMRWDKNVMPWPPVRRAIETAVSALTKAGYEGNLERSRLMVVLAANRELKSLISNALSIMKRQKKSLQEYTHPTGAKISRGHLHHPASRVIQ